MERFGGRPRQAPHRALEVLDQPVAFEVRERPCELMLHRVLEPVACPIGRSGHKLPWRESTVDQRTPPHG